MRLSPQAIKAGLAIIGTSVILLTTQISQHVSLKEATATQTGIVNTIDSAKLVNLKLVCDSVFEPLRRHFGVPIYISSGFRNNAVNSAVGGVWNSSHKYGQALDLDAKRYGKITNNQIYNFIQDSLKFDQLILEGGTNGWVHVSYKKKGNRNQSFYVFFK